MRYSSSARSWILSADINEVINAFTLALGLRLETRSKRRRFSCFSLYVHMCDVFLFLTYPVYLGTEPYSTRGKIPVWDSTPEEGDGWYFRFDRFYSGMIICNWITAVCFVATALIQLSEHTLSLMCIHYRYSPTYEQDTFWTSRRKLNSPQVEFVGSWIRRKLNWSQVELFTSRKYYMR